MRGGALCDNANTATLQNVTKLVPNLVTDSTMDFRYIGVGILTK